MKLLTAIVVLVGCLALQTGVDRVWPDASRYVDVLMVAVVWYAIAVSQRAGMLVGCAAGLMQDAWFQAAAFGISGFKKTLIGWAIGGLGARFDLNGGPSRFVFGIVASLGDGLLDLGLRRLLDQSTAPLRPLDFALRALVTGVLVVAVGGAGRWGEDRRRRRSVA